jgi:hypothetical protein
MGFYDNAARDVPLSELGFGLTKECRKFRS